MPWCYHRGCDSTNNPNPYIFLIILDNVIKYIINILIIYIIIILVLSLGKNLYSIKAFFNGDRLGNKLSNAITDILRFWVMIDPAIIFIVRELIIQLHTHEQMGSIRLMIK